MSASRPVAIMRVLTLLSAAALAGSALGACGSTPGTVAAAGDVCSNTSLVNGLTVKRQNVLPQNHPRFNFAAKVTVSAPGKARSVASAACALPPMPSGNLACGADAGITYRLIFTAHGKELSTLIASIGGCEDVHGLDQTRWALRTPGFWHTLGVAMGLKCPYRSTFGGSMA